jgi:hypothetical protein
MQGSSSIISRESEKRKVVLPICFIENFKGSFRHEQRSGMYFSGRMHALQASPGSKNA